VNYYTIWCNLKDGRRDLEFADAVAAYLGHLKSHDKIAEWRLVRRKFGFGPDNLGEFQITIVATTLAQLDEAFFAVAARSGDLEQLHARVYSMVTDFRSALYRDFPDPERVRS
jgi:hypothetical protein